jgi:hypothetical protein
VCTGFNWPITGSNVGLLQTRKELACSTKGDTFPNQLSNNHFFKKDSASWNKLIQNAYIIKLYHKIASKLLINGKHAAMNVNKPYIISLTNRGTVPEKFLNIEALIFSSVK